MIKKTTKSRHKIPRQLSDDQFNMHVLPHLSVGARGPALRLPLKKIFNYILKVIHTGVQWDQMEIEKDESGNKEIHYTRLFRIFQRWSNDGSLKKVFEQSVSYLQENNKLDLSVLHGDGSVTPAKKQHISFSRIGLCFKGSIKFFSHCFGYFSMKMAINLRYFSS